MTQKTPKIQEVGFIVFLALISFSFVQTIELGFFSSGVKLDLEDGS